MKEADRSQDGADLRRRAEARLREKPSKEGPGEDGQDALKLLHELQVYRIELEVQNEELRAAKLDAERHLERYAELYESAPVAYFTLGPDSRILDVNAAGAALLGAEAASLRDRRLSSFVSEGDRAHFSRFLARVFEAHSRESFDAILAPVRGRSPSVRMEAAVSRVDHGCRMTVTDLSELFEHERELRAAKEKAEAASKAKSEFLSTMSHEIRTPLNGILGFTALLRESEHAEEDKHYLEIIGQCGHSLLALINDILDLAQIEAGRLELAERQFQPAHIVKEVVDSLGFLAGQKRLGLEIAKIELPKVAYGDSRRFRQILFNILGNAVKFTDQGGVVVSLTAEASGAALLMTVGDTGIGMSEGVLGKIFTPFFQANQGMKRHGGGTGLGLAIVKKLLDQIGGSVRVESRAGMGTKVHVRFPVRFLEDEDAACGGPDPTVAARPLRGTSVLVLEDDHSSAMYIARLLSRWGLACRVASSVTDMAAFLKEEVPALILVDLHIEGKDGFDALGHIRGDSRTRRCRVVAQTADALGDTRARCGEAGFDGFLAKPFTPDELAGELTRVLKL